MQQLLAVIAAAALTAAVFAQADKGVLSFEVASIRRNPAADARGSMGPQPGGRFVMVNGTVQSLITLAYGLPFDDSTVDAPAWVRTERYDLNAKAGNPSPTFDEVRLMLRALLKERFQFVAREEKQERSTYTLRLSRPDGRLGPQLRSAPVDCDALRADIAAGKAPPLKPPPATGPATPCTMRSRPTSLSSGGTTMVALARVLTGLVGRVVTDNTGLPGDHAFELQFAPTGTGFSVVDSAQPSTVPSIFTALQELLGLKLESTRAPVDVLVVEHIERPTPD
jgi:uncharacterized protein (TIGR03435 family)